MKITHLKSGTQLSVTFSAPETALIRRAGCHLRKHGRGIHPEYIAGSCSKH
jgi:hypothetical protein